LNADLRTIASGIYALMKTVLVLIGVPLALTRLWLSIPNTPQANVFALLVNATTWAHVVVICVGELWLIAAMSLVREFILAIQEKRTHDATSWSSRWASAIVALLLICSASSSFAVEAGATTLRKVTVTTLATARAQSSRVVGGWSDLSGTDSPSHEAALEWFGLGTFMTQALARRALVISQPRLGEAKSSGVALGTQTPKGDALGMLAPFLGTSTIDWIDGTSRALWYAYHSHGSAEQLPDVRFLRVGPTGIELLLGRALPEVPKPFSARAATTTWVLDPSMTLPELLALTSGCGRLLPCLLPLGAHGRKTYFINLTSSRHLGVVGDPEVVRDVIAGMLVGLRTLPWTEELSVELLGPPLPALEEQCFQMHSSSKETLLDLARSRPHPLLQRLQTDWLLEQVVVVGYEGRSSLDPCLADRVGRVAGIVTAGISGTENLVLHRGRAVLEPFGLSVAPPAPNPVQLQRIDTALATMTSQSDIGAIDTSRISPGCALSVTRG